MRILTHWLEDFVELPDSAALTTQLCEAGVEVESIEDATALMAQAVACEVRSVNPHPGADNLKVCEIFDGSHTRTVVCGASDVRCNMRAVYLPVGASFLGGVLKERIIRGITSDGMLCSRADLGIEPVSAGLWHLPGTTAAGTKLAALLPAHVVLELSITPNRPDLLSHLGIAREVAAASGKRIKPYKWRATEVGPDVGLLARAVVEEATACRRYMARVVRNIKVAPSPSWLQDRLRAIGQRPINNVVDATNYVMHEFGQPLHAFDLSRLALEANLPTLRVRRAHDGESLRTLDGVDRKLSADDLVVADAGRPVALAGVMGGMDTWVQEGTTSVVVEGAYFNPQDVRRTAKRHGLHTEASHRFERGCDPGMISRAIDRCAQLLTEFASGQVAKGCLDVSQKSDGPQEIALRLPRVQQILGLQMAAEAVVQLLDPLGFRCLVRTDASLIFEVPTFRPDVSREIDLIEEVARAYGYGKLPERLPNTEGPFSFVSLHQRPQDAARTALLAQGCTETVNYALANPAHMEPFHATCGTPVVLRNPLGEELSVLRTTLLPGLLQVLGHQLRHGEKTVRLFEVGQVVRAQTQADAASSSTADAASTKDDGSDQDAATLAQQRRARLDGYEKILPQESQHIACVMHGDRHGSRYYNGGERIALDDAQGTLEAFLETFDTQAAIRVRAAEGPGLNPYAAGVVEAIIPDKTVALGRIGRLSFNYAKTFDLPDDVFVWEMSVTNLMQLPQRQLQVAPLPKFPATRRDVAMIAPKNLAVETLREAIAALAGGSLDANVVERVWLFDRFTGASIPKDKVSLAFAISYRSAKGTLKDEQVNKAFASLLETLPKKFAVTIRR